MSKYLKQKLESVKQINSKLHELALEKNIKIKNVTWNETNNIDDRDMHQLHCKTEKKSYSCEISDTALADYQGKAGTERTESMLRDTLNN